MKHVLPSRIHQAVFPLLCAAAIALSASVSLGEQVSSSGQGTAEEQQPSPDFVEDFDKGSLQGWDFSCQHALLPTASGQALQTSGAGHALWIASGDLTDFAIKFRYGYQQGVGDVIFRITESAQGMECYCLKLQPHGISLVRRLHTPDQQFPEKKLASASSVLQPQQWHDVTIQAIAGQIDVAIGDQPILSYLDPTPLIGGKCGLGVIANSGSVLYDDAKLFLLMSAGTTAGSYQAAASANWP